MYTLQLYTGNTFLVFTSPPIKSCSKKRFTRIVQIKAHKSIKSRPTVLCFGDLNHSVTDSNHFVIHHFLIKLFVLSLVCLFANRVYLWKHLMSMWNYEWFYTTHALKFTLKVSLKKWVCLLHITLWEEFIHLNEIWAHISQTTNTISMPYFYFHSRF